MTEHAVEVVPDRSLARAWLAIVRLHFVPLSLTAGILGVAVAAEGATTASVIVGLVMCATGYPFGVLINDVADIEADRINAPDRPLVTGELTPRMVIGVVAGMGAVVFGAALIVAPSIAVWGAIAVAGHFVYQATKGIPMVGNVVNGLDMALFCVIGAAAAAPERSWLDIPGAVWWHWGMIALMLGGFCLVGYFKDIPGDRAAGYRTLPVAIGPRAARWFAIPFPVAAIGIGVTLAITDPGALGADGSNAAFWVLAAAAAVSFTLGLQHLIKGMDASAYPALIWFTRGTVVFSLALGAMNDATLFLAVAAPMLILLEVTMRQTQGTGQA